MGLRRPSTGRGATFTALPIRAILLLCFLAGYSHEYKFLVSHVKMSRMATYLVEPCANASVPVLVEVSIWDYVIAVHPPFPE